MGGSIYDFDPGSSGKFLVVLTQKAPTARPSIAPSRPDRRFIARAKHFSRAFGMHIRVGAWTAVNNTTDARAFETMAAAKKVLKSRVVEVAVSKGFRVAIHAGHQVRREQPSGFRVRVLGPELWPSPNPVEAIGAII